MKFLLSVIALCLVMITAKLYIPQAQAEVGGMDQFDLRMDYDFKRAVTYIAEDIIEDCDVTGHVSDDYLYDGEIDC